jgi:hypothetical protein
MLVPSLTALVLLSILWTAWLPTYATFRRAELQGRKVRVRGRERYVVSLACLGEIITYYPPSIDITDRGVVSKDAHGEPDHAFLASSVYGLPIPSLPSRFDP